MVGPDFLCSTWSISIVSCSIFWAMHSDGWNAYTWPQYFGNGPWVWFRVGSFQTDQWLLVFCTRHLRRFDTPHPWSQGASTFSSFAPSTLNHHESAKIWLSPFSTSNDQHSKRFTKWQINCLNAKGVSPHLQVFQIFWGHAIAMLSQKTLSDASMYFLGFSVGKSRFVLPITLPEIVNLHIANLNRCRYACI